jgi:Kef-type K+ transport system membrane component KefB
MLVLNRSLRASILPLLPLTYRQHLLIHDIYFFAEVVVLIMIPVYFTLSGLKTDFTQLTEYHYWLEMVLLAVAATAAKLPAVMLPAKVFGLDWFDSLSFGV